MASQGHARPRAERHTAVPTDLPTDAPTDLPTAAPTDLHAVALDALGDQNRQAGLAELEHNARNNRMRARNV